jgi:hypothetical protein
MKCTCGHARKEHRMNGAGPTDTACFKIVGAWEGPDYAFLEEQAHRLKQKWEGRFPKPRYCECSRYVA